jgi:hypothetical protein
MIYNMKYDGQRIIWDGYGVFKATSGLPDFQIPDKQCVPDSGPIPEGFYKIYLTNHGTAKDDGTGRCQLKASWGIQKIPRGKTDAGECEPYWAQWGQNRARMEPADTSTLNKCIPVIRGGFYLHDSTKGFSHGCIEVEMKLFVQLRIYNQKTKKKRLVLKVNYGKGDSTNGNTKI